MRRNTTATDATPLDHADRVFEAWRRTRPGRPRIPARLLALAVDVAGETGVHAAARRLRLGYYALKERVGAGAPASARGAGGARSTPPAFVEVVPACDFPESFPHLGG